MKYGSLFTGAGGFELGFLKAGLECAWMSENSAPQRKILEHWWPDTPLYGDIKEMRGEELEPVDIIVGGFPCQDLSVAGHKKGFAGERSSLFFDFVRIVKEMRDATNGIFPRWVVWENVVGLLSRRGGELDTIYAAWAEIGAVVQEHRVLDTGRAFGIPQRRKRVLGAVGFDPRAESCGEILFESESREWNIAKGRKAQEKPAGTLRGGPTQGGWGGELDGHGAHVVTDSEGTQYPQPVGKNYEAISFLVAGENRKHEREIEKDGYVSALTQGMGASGVDVRDAQAGHVIAFAGHPSEEEAGYIGTITGNWEKGPGNTQAEQGILVAEADFVGTITASMGRYAENLDNCKVGMIQPVAFAENQKDYMNSISGTGGKPGQGYPAITDARLRARKLTPTECERLMGWPDGHTAPAGTDTPRYKIIGNGVTAPSAEWLATKVINAEKRMRNG